METSSRVKNKTSIFSMLILWFDSQRWVWAQIKMVELSDSDKPEFGVDIPVWLYLHESQQIG